MHVYFYVSIYTHICLYRNVGVLRGVCGRQAHQSNMHLCKYKYKYCVCINMVVFDDVVDAVCELISVYIHMHKCICTFMQI